MILDTRRNASPRLAKTRLGLITSAAAVLAVLGIYATPRLVLAQVQPARTAATPAPPAAAPTPSIQTVPATPPAPHVIATPETEPANAAPVAAGLPGSEAGPRFKAGEQDTPRPDFVPVPPQALIAPATPLPPGVRFAPSLAPVPYIAANELPGQPAALPRYPHGRNGDPSIEERLSRLEEMVHALMAQQPGAHMSPEMAGEKRAAIEGKMREKDVERMQELAEREASRAAEQAKRAAEQMERGMRDQARQHGKQQREMWGQRIEMLKKQREALERQMEHLEHQIEKLEQEQEKLGEQNENQNEDKASEETAEEKVKEEDKQSEDKDNGCCTSKTAGAPARE